ncbi:MAG TPA: ChbG/HpnK family deacetylase [Candidatus Dormibacteraeota bacterium]|nr:ChbG/HpnK family deacetylase [Candidatus Dormibacteraeota bacterium]
MAEPIYLVVNADDLGASRGINEGIAICHRRGVVTSASLMVTGRAATEAALLSRDLPDLSVGLHWDVWGEDEREFDLSDRVAVRDEFRRQLDRFHALMGRLPTHVDSHRHAHRRAGLLPLFREMVEPLGVPLRGDGRVNLVGGFYAQWEWGVTDLDKVSVVFFCRLLEEELIPGWNEISCHPGVPSPDFRSVYGEERVREVSTLTDARLVPTLRALGIRLTSYAALSQSALAVARTVVPLPGGNGTSPRPAGTR